jgi:hypothetical protein
MAVKIYHAEETLQLLDILRGQAKFNLGGVGSHGTFPCYRNLVAKNFQRRHFKNSFFKIDSETIGGQRVEKIFQVAEVCLPVRGSYMGIVHVFKHTFQTLCGEVHHSLKGLCSVREPKWHEQILKQAKWRDNPRFWDV